VDGNAWRSVRGVDGSRESRVGGILLLWGEEDVAALLVGRCRIGSLKRMMTI